MWDGYIGSQVRRANLRLLLVNTAALIVAALVLGGAWPLMQAWIQGPARITADQVPTLGAAGRPLPALVAFDVPELIPTGYQQVETTDGRQSGVTADYAAVWAGDRLFVVRLKPGATSLHLEGEIRPVPDDLMTGLRNDLPADRRDVLLGTMLDTTHYRSSRIWTLLFVVTLAGIGSFNLVRVTARMRDAAVHPIVRALGGEAALRQFGVQLDHEMAHEAETIGRARLTPNWIAVPASFTTHVARLEDVVWVHLQVTRHVVGLVIPAGKTFAAAIYCRDGRSFVAQGNERQANALLHAVATRAPWVINGWSDALANAWRKDRAGLVAEVDRRRAPAARTAPAA